MSGWARLFVAALIGAVAGAATVNGMLRNDGGADCADCATLPNASRSQPMRITRSVETTDFATRVRAYETADAATLETLLERFQSALAQPPSQAREFMLRTWLGAIAERDPELAVAVLSRAGVDGITARGLAHVVLGVVGITRVAIDRLTDALPRIDRDRLIAEAAARLTETSPDAGIQLALSFDAKPERTLALEAVAAAVAEQDPYVAFRLADSIPVEPGVIFRPSRVVFQMTALRHIARASLLTAVEYVAEFTRTNDSQRARGELMRVIIDEAGRVDPLLALEAARQIGDDRDNEIERTALRRLARDDPALAMTYADAASQGGRRHELRQAIADIYGETDPDAALAWVLSLQPPSPSLVLTVLRGMARTDPLRAIDTVLEGSVPTTRTSLRSGRGFTMYGGDAFGIVNAVFNSDGPEGSSRDDLIEAVGERVLALADEQQRNEWISRYVHEWARIEPSDAFEWMLSQGDAVRPEIFPEIAAQMRGDLTEAVRMSDAIPVEVRDRWMGSIANNMAERGGAEALAWLGQFRSEPFHDDLAVDIAESAARTDPAAALALLSSLSPEHQAQASGGIARSWALADPVAARAWVLGLPAGMQRDAALMGIMRPRMSFPYSMNNMSPPEPQLLALYSSDDVRQRAMLQFIELASYSNPALARAWLDEYVTDPALRSRAESRLRRMGN